MKPINVCPGTLADGYDSYSPICLKHLFDGKKTSPFLEFDHNADENYVSSVNRISVSGVQEKISAIARKGEIIITPEGCHGSHIIKPAPDFRHLNFRQQIPANEHLTMQIARQVYGIATAENAMVFFKDGEDAYITKRFDYGKNGNKIQQEDFCSLMQKPVIDKYSGSYEDIAKALKHYVSAWQIELSKYFALVVFNYLFANGDAHLKNFSLMKTIDGDYVLTPAYDLLNTSIHVNESDFALKDGLMPKSEYSETYRNTGHPCSEDFIRFGHRIGVMESKILQTIKLFSTSQPMVSELTNRSFLDEKTKRMYLRSYQERLSRFNRT